MEPPCTIYERREAKTAKFTFCNIYVYTPDTLLPTLFTAFCHAGARSIDGETFAPSTTP